MRCLNVWLTGGAKWRQILHATSTIKHMSTSGNGVKWLWEAEKYVLDYHEAFLKGTRMGLFEITFNTDVPIQHNQFHQVLQHLLRKSPPLQICLQNRNGTPWLSQPSDLEIDFEVMDTDAPIREVIYQSFRDGYPGPKFTQWKTKLIPRSPDTPCPLPEVKEKFPYQYDLMFTGHHGWMDGIDAVQLLSAMMLILNDVIGGKEVSDEVLGSFSRNIELLKISEKIKKNFELYPDRFEEVKRTLPKCDRKPYLFQAFPPPKVPNPTSKHITRVIDAEILKNFLEKSKEAGVTFNTSFMGVIIAAIVEMVKQKGVVHDTYTIASILQANLRRYLKPSCSHHVFGLYSSLMSYTLNVDKNVMDSFWNHCRTINTELKQLLKQGFPLEQRVCRELVEVDLPATDYQTIVRPAVHDFSITNLGDVSQFIPSVTEHVQLTNVASLNFIHNFVHSNFHEIATFRGRSYYTLTYATNYFTDETAHLLIDTVISVLKIMSK